MNHNIQDNVKCTNMFGCVEMDNFAQVIYEEIKKQNNWSIELNFYDYKKIYSFELFMMAVNGWINDVDTSGIFKMSDDFRKRIELLSIIDKTKRHLYDNY